MFKHIKQNQITGRFTVFSVFYCQNKIRKMGNFRIFVFLSLYGNRETARFPILVFSFQNENPLAAKYTDRDASNALISNALLASDHFFQ